MLLLLYKYTFLIKKYQLRQTQQHDLKQTNKKKQLWNKIK